MPITQIDPAPPAVAANDWRAALLTALGAPVTAGNVNALNAWAASEGINPNNYNWLAITDPNGRWPHAGVIAENGGNRVYAFPSQAIGVQAIAAFLGGSNYTNVVAAFRGDKGPDAIYQAINSSPWCTGCQNNHYPIVLYNGLHGGGFGVGPGSPGAGAAPGEPTGSNGGTPAATGPDVETNNCLLGGQTSPWIIPNVPCVLYQSQARAILGALVLVAGAGLMLIGVYMAATGARPAGLPPLPTPRIPMRGSA